jgi:dGTPase
LRDGVPLFERFYSDAERTWSTAPAKLIFNEAVKRVLDRMVSDLICHTKRRIIQAGVNSPDGVRHHHERLASFSPQVEQERQGLKRFLYENLYFSPALEPEKLQAERVVQELFEYWMGNPSALPGNYRQKAESEPLPRVVCDYLAGMTDNYILQQYEKFCRPSK